MKKALGLFWLFVSLTFTCLTSYIIYCSGEVLRQESTTSFQGAMLMLLIVGGAFFAVLTWRASRYAFKGRARRFWKMINMGWLPV